MSNSNPKILLAIPTYHCEKQIKRVISELNSECLNHLTEIIILDNQSSDQTIEVAKETFESLNISKFKIFYNEENLGLGGSQKKAFQYAIDNEFEHIIILHGDNQAISSELMLLVEEAIQHNEYACVLGSRFSLNSKRINYSRVRTFGNLCFNALYSLFTRRLIADLGSGLNLFSVRLLKKIDFNACSNAFTFNMDLILKIISTKEKIKYIPITWREFDQVSNARNLNVGIQTLKALYNWMKNKK